MSRVLKEEQVFTGGHKPCWRRDSTKKGWGHGMEVCAKGTTSDLVYQNGVWGEAGEGGPEPDYKALSSA